MVDYRYYDQFAHKKEEIRFLLKSKGFFIILLCCSDSPFCSRSLNYNFSFNREKVITHTKQRDCPVLLILESYESTDRTAPHSATHQRYLWLGLGVWYDELSNHHYGYIEWLFAVQQPIVSDYRFCRHIDS
jgi:hypothetical protein